MKLDLFKFPKRARKGQNRGWKITLLRRGFKPCEKNEILEKTGTESWFGQVTARFRNKDEDTAIFIHHKEGKNLVMEIVTTNGIRYFFDMRDMSMALSYRPSSKLFYVEKALAIKGLPLDKVPKGFWQESYGENLFLNPRYQGSRIGFI
jgi:hypothetical protein